MLTSPTVHFHLVQPERRHYYHDVDATEKARERYQPESPPEQIVVTLRHMRWCGTRFGFGHSTPPSAIYTCYARCIISAASRELSLTEDRTELYVMPSYSKTPVH